MLELTLRILQKFPLCAILSLEGSLQDREGETLGKALAFDPPFSPMPSLLHRFGNLGIYIEVPPTLLVEWRHYEDLDITTMDFLQLRTDTEVNNHTFPIFFNTC